MKHIYVQHLLTVLLEEYEDIEYMLQTLESTPAAKRDNTTLLELLNQLDKQNHRLLDQLQPAPK